MDAPSSPPTPPVAVLLARGSVLVTSGGLCLILGRQDALLAAERRLSRWDIVRTNGAKEGASADAKHAGKERRTCMLMAPGPSGWAAGATESRSPVGDDPNLDRKVAHSAVGASEEPLRAARLQARTSNALDSAATTRDYQSAMRMHGAGCFSRGPILLLHCGARPERGRQSARGRRPRERCSGGRRRAATARRWSQPPRRLGGRSRAPSASPTWSTGWQSMRRARERGGRSGRGP